MKPVLAILKRDLALALGGGAAAWAALVFFTLVVSLFPFAVGPAPQTLARIAAGVVWVAALLACLLGLDRLFQPDADDGTLEQYAVHGLSLEMLAATRLASHWLLTALPLILVVPIAAILLNLPSGQLGKLLVSLALGTPGLSALGLIAAAVTVGLRRGGVLAALLVMPMSAPLLIFGVGAFDPLASVAAFKLLAATSLLLVALSPFAAGQALKAALD